MYDIKILNAKFPDYDTNEFKVSDICIKNGKIDYIGTNSKDAKLEIDAESYITSPGFIDIHMHEEELEKYPSIGRFYIAERMLKMGVTTALGGNCGINYQTPEIFINYIKKYNSPINYMLKIGYNTFRRKIGLDSPYDKISGYELDIIQRKIVENIPLGIKGISFGIEYSPGIEYNEMLKVSRLLNPEKHLISAHYRNDGEESISSIEEMISLSEESSIPMQISHIGSCSAYGYMDRALDKIRESRKKNLSVMADCYPYNAFCTYIGSTVFNDGCLERWNVDYSSIMLTQEPYKNVYCTKEIFEDARKNHPNILAVAFVMNDKEIIEAMKSPFVMIGSDEIYNGNQGHPRGAGTFPRVLGKYVREEKHLELSEALYKMTKMPAERLMLNTKGQIKEGYDADITIFDDKSIIDRADFTNDPTAPPLGIKYVMVNGKLVLKNNIVISNNSGAFLK